MRDKLLSQDEQLKLQHWITSPVVNMANTGFLGDETARHGDPGT
jgi:hypothetical protein